MHTKARGAAETNASGRTRLGARYVTAIAATLIATFVILAAGTVRAATSLDLHLIARESGSRAGPVVVLFFFQPECEYCEQVRRDYLRPLLDPRNAGDGLRIVEVDTTSATPLTDFAGRTSTQAAFARAWNVRIVPTLVFVGARGETLAEPLVGISSVDFYQQYLERRLDAARAALATRVR